jgi:thiamine biosynthesis protein ThiS
MTVLSSSTHPSVIYIWINGVERQIAAEQSVADVLASLDLPVERLAVELNCSIVRKRDWQTTEVPSGSRLEIVEFVGGG